jgi:hypothetical protein
VNDFVIEKAITGDKLATKLQEFAASGESQIVLEAAAQDREGSGVSGDGSSAGTAGAGAG